VDCPLLSTTDSQEPAATPGDVAVRGLLAVSRLLAGTTDGSAPDVHAAVLREARVCFQPRGVVLLAQEPGRRLRVICGDVPDGLRGVLLDLDAQPAVAELLSRRLSLVRLDGDQARAIPPLGTPTTAQAAVLLLLLRAPDGFGDAVLVVTDPSGPAASEVATAFGDAAAAALERVRAHEEHERQAAQQRALTRAAKTLNGSLDLDTVLSRICHEAATILGCDVATLYRGTMEEGLTVAAVHGMPPESVGYRLPTGAGLAGKVLVQGRAMLTNDYARVAELPPGAPHPQAISAMGAPMAWDGHPRGVLTVGYTDSREVTQQDLSVLETFAELAATACANASAHAGIVHIARTDGLTGCLNHAALHDSLRREIERATRAGAAPLSLVLVDLDDFKAVNDAHGHLAGDEVLRRAGHALRHATRPYDLAARYGGDEFALITVEADEEDAVEIGRRALARMDTAIREFLPPGGSPGTAGVAQWEPGETVGELVARADRALLYAKQQGARGQVVAFSGVADHFRPGRFARTDRRAGATPPGQAPAERGWPGDRLDERLRKRTRQLALANALGARLAAMTDPEDILHATVEELHRAFGFFCVRLVRAGDDGGAEAVAVRGDPFAGVADQPGCRPTDPGLIGRCLSTRRPAVSHDDVRADPAVPISAGTSCGAPSPSSSAPPEHSTTTTSCSCRPSPPSSAPRCARRCSTPGWSRPTSARRRRWPPPWRPRTPTRSSTPAPSRSAPSRSAGSSASPMARCATSASPPSSTTSGRSRSRRPSCTSPGR